MVGLGDGDGAIENVKGMDGIVDIHHVRLRHYVHQQRNTESARRVTYLARGQATCAFLAAEGYDLQTFSDADEIDLSIPTPQRTALAPSVNST